MIIIEAFRVECWADLCGGYSVMTVEKCISETQARPRRTNKYIPVPKPELINGLEQHFEVTDVMLATLAVENPGLPALDPGEQHLCALLAYPDLPYELDDWRVVCTDRAALNALQILGIAQNVVSLERLLKDTGAHAKAKALGRQYSIKWLTDAQSDLKLGLL